MLSEHTSSCQNVSPVLSGASAFHSLIRVSMFTALKIKCRLEMAKQNTTEYGKKNCYRKKSSKQLANYKYTMNSLRHLYSVLKVPKSSSIVDL